MKQILILILTLPLFIACSNDKEDEPTQDYTSFTFVYHADVISFPNCVVGYKVGDEYKKLAELGDLAKDIPSKEVIVDDESIEEIYLFTDYTASIFYVGVRFDDIYTIKKNKKNEFLIKEDTRGIPFTDKNNPLEYPQ